MATVFGNEFKTSTFSNEVNGMKLTGDLRVDSNNKIESISGTFTKGDEFVGGMTSYYEGDVLKMNYHGINPTYHDEIFAIAKATLVDIDAKYVG